MTELRTPVADGVQAVYFDGEKCSAGLDEAQIRAALASGAGVLWIDLPPIGEDEKRFLHEVFGFHPLAIEDAENRHVDTPKVDDYGEYLFIVAQSVAFVSRTDRLELTEVDIFLGANYVVSVRPRETRHTHIDALFERAKDNPHLFARGSDFLAHTIIDSLIDLLLPAVEEMDESLDELETRILDRPTRELLADALLLKRNTLRLRRSIMPQRDMVNRLSRGEYALIGADAQIFYRDIYDHIVRVEEMLEGLRDLADSVLNSYLAAVNNRMNEIMKTLSVVTVIFLPLSLISGIYGTNLNYSPFGVDFEPGFWLMLTVMLLIAFGLVAYFRYRRWF